MVNKMDQFTIRAAGIEHVGQIRDMCHDILETRIFPVWPEKKIEKCVQSTNIEVIIAVKASELLGFIITQYDSQALIELLAVNNKNRRQGIASALLEKSFDSALKKGLQQTRVIVQAKNAKAINLYEKHKFQKLSTISRYYGGIETALVMLKTLGTSD